MSAELPRGLGPCDRLTVEQALRWLGMGDADGRRFLRDRDLIRRYSGRPRVIVGELVAAHDDAWDERQKARAAARGPSRTSLPRAKL